MLEIEMKFPVESLESIETKLTELGAARGEARTDTDRYFNAPDRDFEQTDEAFRIRSIGDRNFITYKGPKKDAQTKTRTEIELPLIEGPEHAESFATLLDHLGYKFVSVVQKRRRLFHWKTDGFALEICLDDVEGLGQFVELEIVAPEEQLEPAKRTLTNLAEALELKESERRSYLELYLEKQPKTGGTGDLSEQNRPENEV
ncbi:MAG: class IV adenylate cyclase [Gemmataceae bacterium]